MSSEREDGVVNFRLHGRVGAGVVLVSLISSVMWIVASGAAPGAESVKRPLASAESREKTAFFQAICRHDTMTVRKLLKQNKALVRAVDTFGGETGLMDAAEVGDAVVTKLLLGSGADVNARNDIGETALHRAAYSDSVPVIDALVAGGAGLEQGDEIGGTALANAAGNGNLHAVRELLRLGAHVDAGDHSGWTGLIKAASSGRLDVIRVLVAAGAKIDRKAKFADLTPEPDMDAIDAAKMCNQPEIAAYLRAHLVRR